MQFTRITDSFVIERSLVLLVNSAGESSSVQEWAPKLLCSKEQCKLMSTSYQQQTNCWADIEMQIKFKFLALAV